MSSPDEPTPGPIHGGDDEPVVDALAALRRFDRRLRRFVVDRPIVAVTAVAALGYVLARGLRRIF